MARIYECSIMIVLCALCGTALADKTIEIAVSLYAEYDWELLAQQYDDLTEDMGLATLDRSHTEEKGQKAQEKFVAGQRIVVRVSLANPNKDKSLDLGPVTHALFLDLVASGDKKPARNWVHYPALIIPASGRRIVQVDLASIIGTASEPYEPGRYTVVFQVLPVAKDLDKAEAIAVAKAALEIQAPADAGLKLAGTATGVFGDNHVVWMDRDRKKLQYELRPSAKAVGRGWGASFPWVYSPEEIVKRVDSKDRLHAATCCGLLSLLAVAGKDLDAAGFDSLVCTRMTRRQIGLLPCALMDSPVEGVKLALDKTDGPILRVRTQKGWVLLRYPLQPRQELDVLEALTGSFSASRPARAMPDYRPAFYDASQRIELPGDPDAFAACADAIVAYWVEATPAATAELERQLEKQGQLGEKIRKQLKAK